MSENENENLDGQENEELDGITLSEVEPESTETEEKLDNSDKSGEEKETPEGEGSDSKGDDESINQEAVNKKINKVIREKKEAEEATVAERLRREELEVRLKELEQTGLPDIPPIPNYMDPNYEGKIKERDDIIIKHTQEASRIQALNDIKFAQAKADQDTLYAEVQNTIKKFDEKTEELKLDKQTLVESQNVVGSYLTGKQELAQFLLSESPLNVLYLSQNLVEMEKVNKMSETKAAVYIATVIAPKAQGLKPKTTNAPSPSYDPKGNRTSKDKDPNEGNATYE